MLRLRAVTILMASVIVVGAWGGAVAAANAHGDSTTRPTPPAASAVGPKSRAQYGLCNAYLHGKGTAKGKKAKARAFRKLETMLGVATADAVKTSCRSYLATFARAQGKP